MIESKFQLTLAKLAEALIATGAPYGGYTARPAKLNETPHFTEGDQGFYVQLNFLPEATAEDRARLIDVWLAFDFTEIREIKPRASIRQAIKSLSAQERNDLLIEMAVLLLESDPSFATRLGISLEADAPKPKVIKKA